MRTNETVILAAPGTAAIVVSVDPGGQAFEPTPSVSHHVVVAWQVRTIQMGTKDEHGGAVPILCPEHFEWGGDTYLFIVMPDGSLRASHMILQEEVYYNIDLAIAAAIGQSMKDKELNASVKRLSKTRKEAA